MASAETTATVTAVTTPGAADTAATAEVAAPRASRRRGGLVTIATVAAVVVAMGLTLLGLGAADHAVANYDASVWLWSSVKSEMARVNGVTGRVDTRLRVPGAGGHSLQVTQTDQFLILRDLNTGKVSALDLATLKTTATTQSTAGLGVTIALHKDAAFIVDTVQGVVRQLDPRTLVPIGEPVRYPPGISGGTFDGDGRLWIAVPSEGTVSAVTPAPLPAATGDSGGGGGGLSPRLITTLAVAAPSHDLTVSALDDGVAVLDRTTNKLTVVRGGQQQEIVLSLVGPGAMPARTSGADVPVTVVDDRHVYVVSNGAVHDFRVPGDGPKLRPAVAWSGRFYCADDATGTVYVLDAQGKLVNTIAVKGAGGPLELEVREDHLFINAPNSSTARVVDNKHQVRVVDKYANDILGGDPPPPQPPPPPRKPTVGPPSAPGSVTATAGNAQARVSWRPAAANGSAIRHYVVQGDGQNRRVGAGQRSVLITGLTNGETYRFSVHAVNGRGAGPQRQSNPVVPTSEVPDPPERVSAQARPDGTVEVRWPAANGLGRKIRRYAVTAISEGVSASVGESRATSLVIRNGELEYGRQYAFTVVSINDRGASSKPSPVSASVVPFTKPGAPENLAATTATDQKGAVRVSWAPAADNGRPIQRYVVTANGNSRNVTETSATLNGFGDGQSITVRVRAVNEAGDGPERQATARTVAAPTLNLLPAARPGFNSVNVPLRVTDGGAATTCAISVNGGARSAFSCNGGNVNGLWPGNRYTYRVFARNVAGEVSANGAQNTPDLNGTVHCDDSRGPETGYCNRGVGIYSNSRQQSGEAVGSGRSGQTYKAFCKKGGTAGNQGGPNLRAIQYNNNKSSSMWVQITFGGRQRYIPFIWINLQNGDNINALPNC